MNVKNKITALPLHGNFPKLEMNSTLCRNFQTCGCMTVLMWIFRDAGWKREAVEKNYHSPGESGKKLAEKVFLYKSSSWWEIRRVCTEIILLLSFVSLQNFLLLASPFKNIHFPPFYRRRRRIINYSSTWLPPFVANYVFWDSIRSTQAILKCIKDE